MRTNPKIDNLLDQLVSIHLALGVQPSDLADAAFESAYQGIEISKRRGGVHMTVVFYDDMDQSRPTCHKMRYVYDNERRLLRIEQKVDSNPFKVQWDREEAVNSLLVDIVSHLRKLNSHTNIQGFVSAIPEELRGKLASKLEIVA